MAYDRELADRVRHLLNEEPVVEKTMFGGLSFLLGGNMGVSVSGRGGLLVRVEPSDTETLLAEPGAQEMHMGGRGPVAGWIRVTPDVLDDEETLGAWVGRGITHARSLPAK